MSYHLQSHHIDAAETFVAKAWRNGGLAQLDIERFWADDAEARKDPFGADIPQVPFGGIPFCECLFDELGVPEDRWRFETDRQWMAEATKAYNDKAEQIIGRRILYEDYSSTEPSPSEMAPIKGLHDVFEMPNIWNNDSQSYWLMEAATSEDELKALLDRVDARDIRSFILPENWDELKPTLAGRDYPYAYRSQRGPVTFSTSMYGAQRLVMLIHDNPDLAARLRDTIIRVMIELAEVLDAEAGRTGEAEPRGWYWLDDNCYLLNPAMYDFYGYPIVQALFDRFAPDPEDSRGQHSDSDMSHLLPILARCKLHNCNFGPTLTVSQIREHMPRTVIQGQLAPFTYSRNEEVNMVAEFLRDFEMARDQRGLLFATAGSINNGTRLTGMRLLMAAIQEFGRYDR
ncbi:MAG: uroporphyrinogen decarboxylase family protein [Planctomycetota bacterium]|jgi:uroporphyrinogen decarboxylase